MKKFAAVLMAGGQSKRMGTSKALIECGETPLWRLQMNKLVTLRPAELFFSVHPAMAFPSGSWTFVHDRSPDSGPLGGLEAALRLARSNFLVTLAVDMPAMTAEFLHNLLEQSGPAGAVPHLDGYYFGLTAVYPVEILPLVERILAGNDRSFQHLIREALQFGLMIAKEIPPSERSLFENWNAPADMKRTS
jgi:molybdenum cofactor guanylyltransferase